MTPWYKNRIFIAVLILLALLIGGWAVTRFNGPAGDNDTDTSLEEEGDEITVSGTIACLPYRINVAGQQCVKGIKGDDGKVYALNSPRGLESKMSEGTEVMAVGRFEPADISVDESSVFVYDGVLVVRSLVAQ
jgi:hypothetical protein